MKYNTSEQVIACSKETIYKVLSDFRNLEQFKDKLPEGMSTISVVDSDRCEVSLPMAGTLTLCFKEKKAYEKLVLCNAPTPLPFQFELIMQMQTLSEQETSFTLGLDLDVSAFVLAMIGEKKIKKGLDKMAHIFTLIPYDRLAE